MLTDEQQAQIEHNVKRTIAVNEAVEMLTTFYLEVAANVKDKFGIEAAETVLTRFRDNMVAICPIEQPVIPQQTKHVEPDDDGAEVFDEECVEWEEAPEGFVLAQIDGVVRQIRTRAIGFGVDDDWLWMPRSQIYDSDRLFEGQQIGAWPVRRWIAEDKGLGYYEAEE